MNNYLVTGTLTNDKDKKWIHQEVMYPNILLAIESFETDNWFWQNGQATAYRLTEHGLTEDILLAEARAREMKPPKKYKQLSLF